MKGKGSPILLIMFILVAVTGFATKYYLVMIGAWCMAVYELLEIFYNDEKENL